MSARPRIVVASPDKTEVALLSEWLTGEGLEPVPLRSLPAAIQELQSRRCDVLIADAKFAADGRLRAAVRTTNQRAQLVLLKGPDDQPTDTRDTVCLSRPVDQAMLLCHVAMAIAEGRPPRQSARKRVMPLEAIAAGMPAQLIDVSNEGLRLELPNGRRSALPPSFTMRVPLLGITLTVQRVWMNSAPGAGGVAWCGGALHHTPPQARQKWRAFVDALPTR
jgi:CheY-like chemotaxis protein